MRIQFNIIPLLIAIVLYLTFGLMAAAIWLLVAITFSIYDNLR